MLIGQKYLLDNTLYLCVSPNRFNEYDSNGELILERNSKGEYVPAIRLIFDRVNELQPVGKKQLTLF